jgi:hypothetical protein
MRIDSPSASIISSPAGKKTILLDHLNLKKEAMVIPMPQQLELRHLGVPKSRAERQRLLRCRYKIWAKAGSKGMKSKENATFFRAAQKPQMPFMPKMPKLPQAPRPPQSPQATAPPKPPQPTVTEVWSSVKLKTPVLTKVTSALGSQTTYCKPTSSEEPHPSTLEIPPGYELKSS